MREADVFDALDGFYAYSVGSTDSGIRDADLEMRVMGHLARIGPFERDALIGRYLRSYYLTDEKMADYGPASVWEVLQWFQEWIGAWY